MAKGRKILLMPCPFCSCSDVRLETSVREVAGGKTAFISNVKCSGCSAKGPPYGHESIASGAELQASGAWNTRFVESVNPSSLSSL